MNVDTLIQKTAETIKKNTPADTRVFLFGSWAKGNALPTSDIDIGILANEKIPLLTMARIKEEIDHIPTLRSVDLVDFHTVSKKFRNHAIKYAKLV